MISSKLVLIILGAFLLLNLFLILAIWRSKGGKPLSEADLDFIRNSFAKAKIEIQKNLLNGVKMTWTTFDFLLNKKGYEGDLQSKINQVEPKLQNALELKAQKQWSEDLKSENYEDQQQVDNFINIIEQEMRGLGADI